MSTYECTDACCNEFCEPRQSSEDGWYPPQNSQYNNYHFTPVTEKPIKSSSDDKALITSLVTAVTALTNEITTMKSSFTKEVSAIRQQVDQHYSRSRSRESSPDYQRQSRSNSRYWSDTPSRRRYFVRNNLCTYHFRYGEIAHSCLKGCKHFKPSGN